MPEIVSGRTVVTTAGTRVQLGSSVAVKILTITAETDNAAGVMTFGGPDVVGALATRKGTPLAAGVSYKFEEGEIDDLADVWLDATISGDGVTYTYVTE